jgi:23S rRNA (uracil1939-C5)-methyltransferase
VLAPGQIVPLTIEKPAVGGRMIARVDGQVVLVGSAIPGERVHARIERVTKGVAYAATVSVDDASSDRQEAFTDPLCGGCLFAHIAPARQRALKAQILMDACARIGRFTAPIDRIVAGSADEGYRLRARLHVHDGRAGFFREGTHTLCEARSTRQLLPAALDAVDRLLETIGPERAGIVREIELSENLDATGRALHLVLAQASERQPFESLSLPEGTTGISVSGALPGSPVRIVAGTPFVIDTLQLGSGSTALRRHVLSFFQGNRFLVHCLVEHVVGLVEPETTVLDLYAGVGLFAIPAAVSRGARVTAVEGDRISAGDLQANAAVAAANVNAVRESVEVFTRTIRDRPSTIIVDPPRTGMTPTVLNGLVRAGAPRLIYVSCDPATFARDARRLLDAGYTVTRVRAFDLFPNTPHVEAVAELEKT